MSMIRIQDGKEVLDIGFSDIRKYHGNLALMAVAVGFRSLQAAFGVLFGDEVPERKTISILSGHGGPGFRDAFEYATRAVTRAAYQVDTNYPQGQYDPHRAQGYAFVVSSDNGSAVEVVLNKDFLPLTFYDYLKKGREGTMTEADEEAFGKLKLELSERALATPQEELFEIRRLR